MSAFGSKGGGPAVHLNPGTKKLPFEASGTTDTATERQLFCYTIPLDTVVLMEYTIRGRKSVDIGGGSVGVGAGCTYRRTALIENKSGVVIIKKETTQMHEEPLNTWNGRIFIDGIDACVRVRASENDEVNWEVDGTIQELGKKS